jgi:hypothetical protein
MLFLTKNCHHWQYSYSIFGGIFNTSPLPILCWLIVDLKMLGYRVRDLNKKIGFLL